MKKSGLGDSPFFLPPEEKTEATPPLAESPVEKEKPLKVKKPADQKTKAKSDTETMTPRYQGIKTPLLNL
jgi:hypothetical protein